MSETERVTLVGNLTADPELRFTPSGLQVANLRLAVTPRIKDGDTWKDGETSAACPPHPPHHPRARRPAGQPGTSWCPGRPPARL